jgi:hypothetical protein
VTVKPKTLAKKKKVRRRIGRLLNLMWNDRPSA